MKVNELLKEPTCDKDGVCTCLRLATTGMNGRSNGLNCFSMLNRNTGKIRYKYGLVFDRKAKGDDVGTLLLSFCPFCGTPFDDGMPKPV